MFFVANSASVTSVTVHYTTSGGVIKPAIMVMEISGGASSSVADGSVNSGTASSTTTSTSGSLTTTNANDILIFATDASGDETGWTAGTGYAIPNNQVTRGASGSDVRMAMQYKVVSSAQTGATTSMTYLNSNWNGNIFAAFKGGTSTGGGSPTVTFTGAPASAAYQSNFTVTATTNASTLPTITVASGPCSVGSVSGTSASASATVTMTSGTGTCTLAANWAADTNYTSATASQSTTATKIAATVSFTGAPASSAYQSTFTVASTTNATTKAAIAASGACSIAGNTVTMTSGTGTCNLTASWAADANYASATASQSTTAVKLGSTTVIASNTPNPSSAGQAVAVGFNVTGSGSPTGTVTVNASTGETCSGPLSAGAGSCSLTFSTTGSRTLTATYGGDANFTGSASAAVAQSVSGAAAVSLSPTSLTFSRQNVNTTSAPKTVTLSNTGNAPLTVNSITLTGANANNFALTSASTCPLSGGTVAAAGNCTIVVTFTPTSKGGKTAAVSVADNASGSPQQVSLSGTGH